MAFTYARNWVPRKAQTNKLKPARNENEFESFYAYENVMRL